MKRYNGVIAAIAFIGTMLFIIGIIVTLIFVIMGKLSWVYLVIELPCGLIVLISVWALNNALERISVLENILKKKDIVQEDDLEAELDSLTGVKRVTHCKACGYQLFKEDKVCPNCGAKVESDSKDK